MYFLRFLILVFSLRTFSTSLFTAVIACGCTLVPLGLGPSFPPPLSPLNKEKEQEPKERL